MCLESRNYVRHTVLAKICLHNKFYLKYQTLRILIQVGDDLRQDALIMQLLRVMSDLWKKEELDMQMMLYDCISTGNERGLLQIVGNANTLGE